MIRLLFRAFLMFSPRVFKDVIIENGTCSMIEIHKVYFNLHYIRLVYTDIYIKSINIFSTGLIGVSVKSKVSRFLLTLNFTYQY